MSLREEMQKKREEELKQNQEPTQAVLKMQSEIDKLNSLMQTLNTENENLKSRILSMSEIEKEKTKKEQELQNLKTELNQQKKNQLISQEQDDLNSIVSKFEKNYEEKSISEKISIVIKALENERKKPPAIKVKEKEVVKIEPKCTKCNQKEYTYKLEQLKCITYGALAYSIIITIIATIKNKLIRADFKTFLGSAWSFIKRAFRTANNGFIKLSEKVDNNILQMVIHIGLWVLIAGAVGFGIYKLISELQYKTWTFWNIGAVSMVLIDLILIVYLADPIKNLIKLNLFIFALLFYAGYIVIRIIVNVMKNKN